MFRGLSEKRTGGGGEEMKERKLLGDKQRARGLEGDRHLTR